MSQLETDPRGVDVGSAEMLPIAVDFTAVLEVAETVNGGGAPTCGLTDLTDASSTAGMLTGPPTVSGNRVQQTVTGLRAGHRYRLEVIARVSASKVWAAEVEINCPW